MTVSEVRDEIVKWGEALGVALGAGKITQMAYKALMNRINALSSTVDELEASESVVVEIELTAEITAEATEIGVAVAVAVA